MLRRSPVRAICPTMKAIRLRGLAGRGCRWSGVARVMAAMVIVGVAAATDNDTATMRWTDLGGFTDHFGQSTKAGVYSLALDPHHPDTLWVGLRGDASHPFGIFKMDDPAKGWVCAYQTEHYNSDWTVTFAPSRLSVVYAATSSLFLRSDDGGLTWAKIREVHGIGLVTMAVDPTDHLIFLTVRDGGWGVERNGVGNGGGWKTALEHQNTQCIAIDATRPSTIFVGARYIANGGPRQQGGVFRTTDEGESWALVFRDPDVAALAIDPANSNCVFAGTQQNGLFRSSDGGTTWTKTVAGLAQSPISAIAFSPANSRVVYAGTRGEGVFRSEDGGASWKPLNDALGDMWITALAVHPQDSDRLYAGTRTGVFSWGRPPPVALKPAEPPSAPAIAADERIAAAAPETEPTLRGYRLGLLVLAAAAVGLVSLLWKVTRRKILPTAGDDSGVPPAAMSTVSSASSGAILVDSGPRWAEAIGRTRQAAMAGYVFSGIYALVFIFEAARGSTRFGLFLGVFCLVEAVLFFSGSLLAKARRHSLARVIWLIAGYAGIPLGLIMVGFANRMNMALKAAAKESAGPPLDSVQLRATAGTGAASRAVEVRSDEDPLKRACKKEIMRFLTTARTRQHEQKSGARWSRNDLLLVVTKAGLDQGRSPDVFFAAANAAVDELARERSIAGTDSGYRAN